jgi:hypothetical protein
MLTENFSWEHIQEASREQIDDELTDSASIKKKASLRRA